MKATRWRPIDMPSTDSCEAQIPYHQHLLLSRPSSTVQWHGRCCSLTGNNRSTGFTSAARTMVLLRPLRRFPAAYHRPYQHVSPPLRNLRSFHNTRRNQFIEPVLGQIHDLLTGFHTFTGLSWAATIPLTAVFVRLCIAEPLQQASHGATQRQLDLLPLTNAWRHVITAQVLHKMGRLGPLRCEREILLAVRAKRIELYKKWRCQYWRNFLPLAQFPVWLAIIETLRRMCGAGEGLLAMASRLFRGTSVETSCESTLEALKSVTIPVEASLAEEGALWFPDLLAPDPLLVLPFLLSGTFFATLHLMSRSKARSGRQSSIMVQRYEKALKIFALAIGPVTLQVPSALLLYWISSSMLAMVSRLLIDRLMPFRRPPEPCRPKKTALGAELLKP